MKKVIKRTISTIIALTIVISFCVISLACLNEHDDDSDEITTRFILPKKEKRN
ncbi:MAG: hypothetical protein LBC71_04050 [Oscillospiraceae bacterium]|jgi:hypothetical protein|nr:hypothetical protein [Oscillospiraceae bacterium]